MWLKPKRLNKNILESNLTCVCVVLVTHSVCVRVSCHYIAAPTALPQDWSERQKCDTSFTTATATFVKRDAGHLDALSDMELEVSKNNRHQAPWQTALRWSSVPDSGTVLTGTCVASWVYRSEVSPTLKFASFDDVP
eukprot:5796700-Amphidinium_carterae.1